MVNSLWTSLVLTGLVILTSFNPALAQIDTTQQLLEVEAGGLVSSSAETPFWLRANQFGAIPLAAPAAVLQVRIRQEYPVFSSTSRLNRFKWGFGLHTAVNLGATNRLVLPEAFVSIRYGKIELFGGRRQQVIGLGDTTLSSGFIIGSGNALPIPKIQLGTKGYAFVPFTGRFVAINAGFAHGWYSAPYIKGAYLHQSNLYLRLGKAASLIKVHAGINHQVLWGGQADYLKGAPSFAVDGRLPSSLRDYIYVVTGTVPNDWYNRGYTANDSYGIGNHLGSYDVGLEVTTRKSAWMLYYQHPYEDVSSLIGVNFPDGLWGLRWASSQKQERSSRFQLRHLTLEHLTTLDQSGSTFYVTNSSYQGQDNYFNHGQYKEGWSYKGRAIGTPFIAPATDYLPDVQKIGAIYFPNNRVSVWYVGAQGLLFSRLDWTMRLSYSLNYGRFQQPFDPVRKQFSSMLSVRSPLLRWPNTYLLVRAGLDEGNLYSKSVGCHISVQKRW